MENLNNNLKKNNNPKQYFSIQKIQKNLNNNSSLHSIIQESPIRRTIQSNLQQLQNDDTQKLLVLTAPTGVGKNLCISDFIIQSNNKNNSKKVMMVSPRINLVKELKESNKGNPIQITTVHSGGDEQVDILVNDKNWHTKNTVFCNASFVNLLKKANTGEIEWNVFDNQVILIDEAHLISSDEVSLLKTMLAKSPSVKLGLISATNNPHIIESISENLTSNSINHLNISTQNALNEEIIRPYISLEPKTQPNSDDECVSTMESILSRTFDNTPISQQKIAIYLPKKLNGAKQHELKDKIKKLLTKLNIPIYDLMGSNAKNAMKEFSDNQCRIGAALCCGRMKEGSNFAPNIIFNFQNAKFDNLTQIAGRLNRFPPEYNKNHAKATHGLFINLGGEKCLSIGSSKNDGYQHLLTDFPDFQAINQDMAHKNNISKIKNHTKEHRHKTNQKLQDVYNINISNSNDNKININANFRNVTINNSHNNIINLSKNRNRDNNISSKNSKFTFVCDNQQGFSLLNNDNQNSIITITESDCKSQRNDFLEKKRSKPFPNNTNIQEENFMLNDAPNFGINKKSPTFDDKKESYYNNFYNRNEEFNNFNNLNFENNNSMFDNLFNLENDNPMFDNLLNQDNLYNLNYENQSPMFDYQSINNAQSSYKSNDAKKGSQDESQSRY